MSAEIREFRIFLVVVLSCLSAYLLPGLTTIHRTSRRAQSEM